MKVDVGLAENDTLKNIYYDRWLTQQLDEVKKRLRKDEDCVAVIDGFVGSGKSTIAQQCGIYVSPGFNIQHICFDGETFSQAIINAKKRDTIVFDEALAGFNTRRTMSSINTTLVSLMTEIRQKNLFILLCLPSIFDLDRSISMHRSLFLIHCFNKGGQRGYFKFYGQHRKAQLLSNMKAKKTYSYPTRSNFVGKFCKGYTIDEEEYRKLKDRVLKRYIPEATKSVKEVALDKETEVWQKMRDSGMNMKQIADIMKIPHTTVKSRFQRLGRRLEDSNIFTPMSSGVSSENNKSG